MKRIAVVTESLTSQDSLQFACAALALSHHGVQFGIFSNSLTDSSRIDDLRAKDFDALVLSALKSFPAELGRQIAKFFAEQKPIFAIAESNTVLTKALSLYPITVAQAAPPSVAHVGTAIFETCAVDDFITDREHRVISTPGYLHANATLAEVHAGIGKAIAELVELA